MRKPFIAMCLTVSAMLSTGTVQAALPTGTAQSELAVPASAPQAGVTGASVVQFAQRYLGYVYTAVGNSPSEGFSCIGFVSYVYRSLGINLPDSLGGAMAFASPVAFSNLQPGDVLFFQNTVWNGLSHTGIYIGGGKMVHAEWYGRGVVISSFTGDPVDGNYWMQHYLGASRPWASAAVARPAAPARVQAAPVRRTLVRRTLSPLPNGPRARVLVPALNLRSAPSLHGGIVTALRNGTQVALLGHANGWYRLGLRGGTVGWAVGAGIGHGSVALSPSPVRRVTLHRRVYHRPARVQTPVRTIGAVTVQVSGLRVHSGPALGAPVISGLGLNQRVGLVGRFGQWARVRLSNGATGWVSSQYVGSGASRTVARTTRTSSPTRSSASASRVATAINVRARPSMVSAIAGVLAPGRTYRSLGSLNGWVRVRVSSGVTGWVVGSLLSGTASVTSSSAWRRRVSHTSRKSVSYTSGAGSSVAATVRVHSSPSLSSPAVAVAYAGTPVHILGTGVTWVGVRLPTGRTGYVLRSYVR